MGHTKDVLSVAFSADNRQIVSGSRDRTVKLWNTLGVCKYTIQVCCRGAKFRKVHVVSVPVYASLGSYRICRMTAIQIGPRVCAFLPIHKILSLYLAAGTDLSRFGSFLFTG